MTATEAAPGPSSVPPSWGKTAECVSFGAGGTLQTLVQGELKEEQPVGSSGCDLSIVVGRVAAIHCFTGVVVGGGELWKCWGEHSQGLGSFVWPTLSHGWILHVFGHQEAQRWNDSFSSFSPGASYKPLRLIIYA